MSGKYILPSVPQMLRNAFNGEGYQDERLARIKERFASIPEGKALLELAEKLNYPISIERDRESYGYVNTKTTYVEDGNGQFKVDKVEHKVNLDPRLSDDQMIEILAHELRHVWQRKMLGVGEGNPPAFADPRNSIAYTRLIEGDAHAFQKYFMDKLAGRNPSPESMQETFFKFQGAFWRPLGYDLKSLDETDELKANLKKGVAAQVFNGVSKASLEEVGDLRKILVAGLDENAPPYLNVDPKADVRDVVLNRVGKLTRRMLSKQGYEIAA